MRCTQVVIVTIVSCIPRLRMAVFGYILFPWASSEETYYRISVHSCLLILREELVIHMLSSNAPNSAKVKFMENDDAVLFKSAMRWPTVYSLQASTLEISRNHFKLFGPDGLRHRACHRLRYPYSATHCFNDLSILLEMSNQFGLPRATTKINNYIHNHFFPHW